MQTNQLAIDLAETLTDDVDDRAALVALGMVASGIICEAAAPGAQRLELVETFCSILRQSIITDMN